MTLKRRSYRHLRPKSKVEKAIHMANLIERKHDPLRDSSPRPPSRGSNKGEDDARAHP